MPARWLRHSRAEAGSCRPAPLKDNCPADAVKLLRDHYGELPQPDGDLNLADCYLAAGDQPRAAEMYQRIVSQYLTGDAATRAAAALVT
jgi:hypothetical protein